MPNSNHQKRARPKPATMTPAPAASHLPCSRNHIIHMGTSSPPNRPSTSRLTTVPDTCHRVGPHALPCRARLDVGHQPQPADRPAQRNARQRSEQTNRRIDAARANPEGTPRQHQPPGLVEHRVHRFADFTKAQPLSRCLARLGRGKLIPVSVRRSWSCGRIACARATSWQRAA